MTNKRPFWLDAEELPSATFDVPPAARSKEWVAGHGAGYAQALAETREEREKIATARMIHRIHGECWEKALHDSYEEGVQWVLKQQPVRRAEERFHRLLAGLVALACVLGVIAIVWLGVH